MNKLKEMRELLFYSDRAVDYVCSHQSDPERELET